MTELRMLGSYASGSRDSEKDPKQVLREVTEKLERLNRAVSGSGSFIRGVVFSLYTSIDLASTQIQEYDIDTRSGWEGVISAVGIVYTGLLVLVNISSMFGGRVHDTCKAILRGFELGQIKYLDITSNPATNNRRVLLFLNGVGMELKELESSVSGYYDFLGEGSAGFVPSKVMSELINILSECVQPE
jgi:hypothetical protein